MDLGIDIKKRIICPFCNYIVIKLVPLYEHDQEHKLQQCCTKCKKKIKNGEEIVKFVRRDEDE